MDNVGSMPTFGGAGARRENDSLPRHYASTTPVDTSHYLANNSASSFLPIATKTVDVQTDAFDDLTSRCNGTSTQVSSSKQAELADSPTSSLGQQFSVRQQQQLAKIIESEMKEKYMEQTRTLEQFQVLIKQDLIDKQAQLMLELQRGMDISPNMANGGDCPTGRKFTNGASLTANGNGRTEVTNGVAPSTVVTMVTCKSPTLAVSSPLHNGYPPIHNGKSSNGQLDHHETGNSVRTSSSFSADESVNGNTSQGSSSHDTWDSTNAFTHERPVLTGSERSTPTPVLPSVDSSNDMELLSQSIHIPVDSKEGDSPELGLLRIVGKAANSSLQLTDLKPDDVASHLSEPPVDDSTPRNQIVNDSAPAQAPMISDSIPQCNGIGGAESSMLESSMLDEELRYSSSSTPPPQSPADELSASLRYSLREKHSRHLADMKAYYEQELSDLKHKLTSCLDVTQHEAYSSLQAQNEKLRDRCRVLEEELIRANRYINTVDKQMEDLESSFNASMVASSRVKSQTVAAEGDDSHEEQMYKNKFTQAESYIKSLEAKNKDLLTALCDAYEVRDNTSRTASHTNLLYDEMKAKYEELRTSNDRTQVKLQSAEDSLKESREEMSTLKSAIRRLEVEHKKLAKENEVLRLTSSAPLRNGSHSKLQSNSEEHSPSPILKAEKELEKPSSSSPHKHRSRHHHYRSDRSRHHSKRRSSPSTRASAGNDKLSPPYNSDLSNQLSPQPLSDATQSSDNSSRDYSKVHYKSSSRKSTQAHSSDHRLVASDPSTHTLYQDDLISAYSPIVDRQRHSSSASSSGPAIKPASSPSRQSIERPYGFHHVGASVSPSRRTQQWAIRSPFNRLSDTNKKEVKNHQNVSPSAARKNLSFTLNRSLNTSPQKTKIDKEEVLEKVRSGRVHSDDADRCLSPTSSVRKPTPATHSDRLKLIKDAETRHDELLVEKNQLESSLTRMSTSHSRKDKQRQEDIERQLDKVDKDLGSVRMTLRRYNAL